ncbi:MAG TPA: hypothetical protein VFI83_09480, partial [Gaiella sp.]|nr:hypothetical protein [Gaiella sp.]
MRIRSHLARLGEKQRYLQSPPPRRREQVLRFMEHVSQKVGQPGKGERGLGLDAAAGQGAVETLATLLDARLPE